MLEVSARIVEPGVELTLEVRRLQAIGQDLTPDLLHRACDRIRKRYGLAAVPAHQGSEILAVSHSPIKQLEVEEQDWCLEVQDTGNTRTLRFKSPADAALLTQLFERGLMARLEKDRSYWTINRFPRIFYDDQPFMTSKDIAVYRRYEVSSEPVEGVGVGLIIELSTAFFTIPTVAEYFRDDLPEEEQEARLARFNHLRYRRGDKKGTLLYDNGRSRTTCYFDSFPRGVTAASTGKIRIKGNSYLSLKAYYKQAHGVTVNDDDLVAKVSFARFDKSKTSGKSEAPGNGLNRPQFVCANMLRLRVNNESLTGELKHADKLAPDQRDELINRLWIRFNHAPLGQGFPKVSSEFWRPSEVKKFRIPHPDLMYKDGYVLRAPRGASVEEHRDYYRKCHNLLNRHGCYDVPPAIKRSLHVASRNEVPADLILLLSQSVTARLTQLTGKEITWVPTAYSSLEDAFMRLRRTSDPGHVLFVFEGKDPAEYFMVSHELKGWRVKRVTTRTLRRKSYKLHLSGNGDGIKATGDKRSLQDWDRFVEMCALDILQQMDCIPWTLASPLKYPAHLAIDVGEKHRHFALSLLICRPGPGEPTFWLDTKCFDKVDGKGEEINPVLLRDAILSICQRVTQKWPNFTPLPSLLVFRDGRDCGDEIMTILDTATLLNDIGLLGAEKRIDVVDVFKNSVKGLRMWERSEVDGIARNALEGHAVKINRRKVVMINTGAATLTQGTADPVVLYSQDDRINMHDVASDFHVSSHFNWSSPAVAQKLALVLKRTDEILKHRAAEELGLLR